MRKYIILILAISLLFRWPSSNHSPVHHQKFELPPKRKIDINRDSRLWLQSLKKIGPKRAQLIIDNRPYQTWDDLLAVKGISTKLVELWKPDILPLMR